MTNTIDHKAKAVERLATEFKKSVKLIAYIKALLEEADTLEQVFKSIIDDRWIDTATGFSLDVIGVIVGQPRTVIDVDLYEFFGFDNNLLSNSFSSYYDPSVGGRFISKFEPESGDRVLNDEEYRIFIRARIIRNHTKSTPDDIIRQIQFLFGAGVVLIIDGDTEYEISIGSILTPSEKAILSYTDLIVKTAGVRAKYIMEFDSNSFWGFRSVPGAKGFGSVSSPLSGGKFGNLI